MKWLRENLANRVKRVSAPEEGEDYPTGKRRPGGPRFDKRSGLLISHGTRPYTEFGGVGQEGDDFSPEGAVDNKVARRNLQTAGGGDDDGHIVMPADRDTSSRILRKKTLTEWLDGGLMMTLLERDRPAFDKLVRQTIVKLQPLAARLGLDQEEAGVLAVITLLYADEPRTYLNFVPETDRKRIRNAWDRLDRKRKKPEFRKILQSEARKRRDPIGAKLALALSEPSKAKLGSTRTRGAFGLPAYVVLRWHGQLDRAVGILLSPWREASTDDANQEGSRTVTLASDLSPKQRALYRSSAGKKPRQKTKLYSD